jgi:hypothetical protein
MAKSAINQDSVNQFCNEVYVSTGKDPTYEDVKNGLGGSYSTIKLYLPSWLAKERPPRFPLPDAIRTKAAHLAQVIWSYALADARQIMDAKEHKREEAMALKDKELDVAMQELLSVENERDRLAASVDSLLAERAELRVRLEGLDRLAAQLEASQAAEVAMRDQRDQAREELNLGRGQIQAMERQIAQLLQASQALVKPRRVRNGHTATGPAASN